MNAGRVFVGFEMVKMNSKWILKGFRWILDGFRAAGAELQCRAALQSCTAVVHLRSCSSVGPNTMMREDSRAAASELQLQSCKR